MTVEITELEELEAEKVSGVGSPANGTPWLLLKAMTTHDDPGAVQTSSGEADEIEDQLTKEEDEALFKASSSGFCGEDCDVCKERYGQLYDFLLKAKLKAKERHALPTSTFAVPGRRAYPIHDKSHARNALARVSQHGTPSEKKRVRAAVRRKYPTIDVSKMSPGVPDEATETPTSNGTVTASSSGWTDPGKSAVGPREAVNGRMPDYADTGKVADFLGGDSTYTIPAERKVNTTGNPPVTKDTWTITVTDGALKDGNWMSVAGPSAAQNAQPGNGPWEMYDAATLDSVARGLAAASRAVDAIAKREVVEAVNGNPSDWFDAFKLGCANDDINHALGLVAALSFHEAAEGARKDGGGNTAVLRAARNHLSKLLGDPVAGDGTSSSEEATNIMAEVTKEELAQFVKQTSIQAVAEAIEAERKKARKAAKKAEKRARKNANNGGDITAEEEAGGVRGRADANNVNAVPDGGHVDPQYVNKGEKKAYKELLEKVETLTETVQKFANRPRAGGPVTDGQARGGAFLATEGRDGTVTKEAETEIERLQKELDAEKDPVMRTQRSRALTLAKLRAGHEAGLI